jgi:integrase
VVRLTRHKTAREVGDRLVPLTPQARRLLAVRLKSPVSVSLHSLDALWRKYRDQSLIPDLHFHDMRATALTHLARRMSVLELARISGHRDLSLLLSTYFRASAEEIAARLATPKR